jgi:hypothetical protein
MSAIPTSFDFDGQALRPDYVVKCSYGNDSIALLQYLHEYNQNHPLGKVVVLFNDTGWAAKWWIELRVPAGERFAERCGFIPCRTARFDWDAMLVAHNVWPDKMRRFCTQEAKIIPTMHWLSWNDPDGLSEMVCGVRREESADRANWPEYVESDSTNEGRAQWSPLVLHTEQDRNELLARAGYKPLPHRSRECRCVLANSTDIKTWDEDDKADIRQREKMLSDLNRERDFSNKFMFHPFRKKGRPEGIDAVVEWAKRVPPKKAKLEPGGGCDSGYCTG